MPMERSRLVQLALETLENRRREVEKEIALISGELRVERPVASAERPAKPARKRPRFSKAERARRSARMKAYWENIKRQKKAK